MANQEKRKLGLSDIELSTLPPPVAERIRIMQENLQLLHEERLNLISRPQCPVCKAHFYQCNVCGHRIQKGIGEG